ncbi:MAG TPA: NlpC/P60 family protein [Verrucomicrobiae bacterium]|jgi:cell wall-associated NlpC family hydrolase
MARSWQARNASLAGLAAGCLMALAAGCASPNPMKTAAVQPVLAALERVKQQFAPDPHLAIFDVAARQDGKAITLEGEVNDPSARQAALDAVKAAGFRVHDRITVLPAKDLEGRDWGIASVSLVNLREKPGNAAEMGTQAFMGEALRVWKSKTNWFLVQTADHYLGWTEGGAFTPSTRQDIEAWQSAPLLIVTALEERILERPGADAAPVSDVVQCDLVKRIGDDGDWLKVGLPDGRAGYLPKGAAADFARWQKGRRPTPENIERAAKSFMGRPYFWGCNSARGLDCSGFTKLVYYLNGIQLNRNASEQCRQGVEVPLDGGLKNLKKGDLLFFGRAGRRAGEEKITHVAIYLQDKLFIQSSVRVHVSSLDPDSPLSDRRRIRTLLHARRVLPNP